MLSLMHYKPLNRVFVSRGWNLKRKIDNTLYKQVMSFIAFLTDFVSIRAHIQFFLIAPWMGLQLGISQVELLHYNFTVIAENGLLEIEIEMYTLGGFRFILPDLIYMTRRFTFYLGTNKRRDIGFVIVQWTQTHHPDKKHQHARSISYFKILVYVSKSSPINITEKSDKNYMCIVY
ncbi:hypothetical protein ACJX0J_009507 [Zea mays]